MSTEKLLLESAGKIWLNQPLKSDQIKQEIDLELQRKVLSVFSVGDFYYYIFNIPELKFDYVSPDLSRVLGYSHDEFTVAFCLEKIHPNDKQRFLNYENTVMNFFGDLPIDKIFQYKVRYHYRIMKADGTYARILQQSLTINHTTEGGIIHVFGVHTDISNLKVEGDSALDFIGLKNEPSYLNYPVTNFAIPNDESIFTNREKEILNLLWEGKESKEIAEQLFVSAETVNTHRRNMLFKANAKNTIELIRFALQKGVL